MPQRSSLDLDWLNGDVLELRRQYEAALRIEDGKTDSWEETRNLGQPVRLLIHRPSELLRRDCAVFYFHGGAWIVGSPSTHADISRALCERTGLHVVSVDYRLAPEHVAPAPIDDGMAALVHIFSGSGGRVSCNRAILCGDSAGAAIALALERRADVAMRGNILGVCSLYGGFGVLDSHSLNSWGSREQGLDADCVRRFWSLANPPGGVSPYSIAALGGFSDVPAYLLAAARDPLRDDSLALAEALQKSGREMVFDLVEGETHGFLHNLAESERSGAALDRVCAWMRRSAGAR
jgi:acetyl esterase